MPPIDLKAKPIVITGASSGIGRATAVACAQAGMPVVVSARREGMLAEVVEEIRVGGGRAEAVAGDVSDPEDCRRAVARCVEAFGSVYAVFANAGYGLERAAHEISDEELRAIFEVNFFGTMNTIRAALPHMLAARSGHVLICSSSIAQIMIPRYAAYTATKAAQHHFGRSMRMELRPMGVHVTTVHPVGTKTEFFDTAHERSGGATLFDREGGRFMQTSEVVARGVVRALRKPRAEVWTSLPAQAAIRLSGLSPRLAEFVISRAAGRRARRAGGGV